MEMNHSGGVTVSPLNQYKYNGKEMQVELDLKMYDFGARLYDAVIGRWTRIDNKAEMYFNWSPYNYALNTPVNAVDPDGNLVIFIAGQNTGDGGTLDYWRGYKYNGVDGGVQDYYSRIDFFKSVQQHFNDRSYRLYDGGLGGWSNTFSLLNLQYADQGRNNLFLKDRISAGYDAGKADVKDIIRRLKHSGSVITESIKVIAHSMGSAYAKGLIQAIIDYAKAHPNECQGLRITEYDFAAYQQNKMSAIPGVTLFQFDNQHGDWVIVNGPVGLSRILPPLDRIQKMPLPLSLENGSITLARLM
ncbi:hypothetical protein GS398_02635 [Pedobacter sp. HMF7056]|uniref:RHS repeat-associated core domain-containing protein n=2 Tax=Hufsiella ginkgonis TaxID=2695274 RepID=A0A7K1XT57_9SPHI|nr:hypothetical protein [Hufsiella ginkgonis]